MKFQVHFNNGQSEICIHDHKGLVFYIRYFNDVAECIRVNYLKNRK